MDCRGMRPSGGIAGTGALRGQASAEYLLLSVVSLSLLMVSASALSGIRGMAQEGADGAAFAAGAYALANAADEACALGYGNGLEVELAAGMSVESEAADGDYGPGRGWAVRYMGTGGQSAVRQSRCEVRDADIAPGAVYVENEEGRIAFRGR